MEIKLIDNLDLFEPIDLSTLLNNGDKVGDTADFSTNVGNLPALAIINNEYANYGFDHQAAAEKALDEAKCKPYTVSRGFIDLNNRIAFLILYADKGGAFIRMLQSKAKRYPDKGEPVVDFDKAAQKVKDKFNLIKVYALGVPSGNQVTRLAKKFKTR